MNGTDARTYSYTYYSDGKVKFKYDGLGTLVEQNNYNPIWGTLSLQYIPGLYTAFAYDDFGRLKNSTNKANTLDAYTVASEMIWDIQGNNLYYTYTQHPGDADTKKWYDVLGRGVKNQTESANTTWTEGVRSYDVRGNIMYSTEPYFVGGTPSLTYTYLFDDFNRLETVSNNQLTNFIEYSYIWNGGNTTVGVTDYGGKYTEKTTDPLGRVIQSLDNGGVLMMTYTEYPNPIGQITELNGQEVTSINYDEYGRQSELRDNSAGTTTYSYNAFGDLITQRDAKGNQTDISYDVLGRIESRTNPEGTTTYEYWTTSGGGGLVNEIKKITNYNGDYEEFSYGTYRHLSTKKEQISGTLYTTNYAYNQYDQIISTTLPGNFKIVRDVDANGFLQTVSGVETGANPTTTTLFTGGTRNASGLWESYTLGNGANSYIDYDDWGRPTHKQAYINPYNPAQTYQNLELNYDPNTGNLLSRVDYRKWIGETFTFDNLDRLTSATVGGVGISSFNSQYYTFANNGNVLSKTDAGVGYNYDSNKRNAVIDISFPSSGTAISLNPQTVSYTSFDQPLEVVEQNFVLDFRYGADEQRNQTLLYHKGSLFNTRIFLGEYEKNISKTGVVSEIYYISGGDGLCAMVVKK